MEIYYYVEIIGQLLLPPICLYNIHHYEKHFSCETVHIHIHSLINIIQGEIGLLPPKKGKGKISFFRVNLERLIPIYGV